MHEDEGLYMIEEVNTDENVLVLANYIWDKKVRCSLPEKRVRLYASFFDEAIERNMFVFVVYNEKEKQIVV